MNSPWLKNLKIQNLRCFDRAEVEWRPGRNYIIGRNAEGKTSLLEAICLLTRLESPRTGSLKSVIRHEEKGFAVQGELGRRMLQFYYGLKRRKLALDRVEQKKAGAYLNLGSLVFMANADVTLVSGSPSERRKFLDFLATQVMPDYRDRLRGYNRALARRNRLLKNYPPQWAQIEAYTEPLVRDGQFLVRAREQLVRELLPWARESQQKISTGREPPLELRYERTCGEDFPAALEAAREEEARLGQTLVGPHRDDLLLELAESQPLGDYGSEGQQRTAALALKMAQFHLTRAKLDAPPLLLIDDVFGELDRRRRNALMADLPPDTQTFITTTTLDWLDDPARPDPADEQNGLYRIEDHRISQ